MPEGPKSKIFINYQRGDDPGFTTALYQNLELEFGRDRIFMDVEGHIKPGDDFLEVIGALVGGCEVLLAIIGPRWAELLAARPVGSHDFVAIEIKAALDGGKRVIPVLVGGARFPPAEIMPEEIRALARKNAVGLRPDRFKADCQGIFTALKDAFVAAEAGRAIKYNAHIRDPNIGIEQKYEPSSDSRSSGSETRRTIRWFSKYSIMFLIVSIFSIMLMPYAYEEYDRYAKLAIACSHKSDNCMNPYSYYAQRASEWYKYFLFGGFILVLCLIFWSRKAIRYIR
jgi:hypothetical protein